MAPKLHLIRSIHIKGLFGLYTYTLPTEDILGQAGILYGDNGVGKSTILELAFHLLSPMGDRGHRTALYRAPFNKMEVTLSTGFRLTAERKKDGPIKILVLGIHKGNKTVAIWDFHPKHKSDIGEQEGFEVIIGSDGEPILKFVKKDITRKTKSEIPRGEQPYMDELKKAVPAVYLLSADRKLLSDLIADPSDEMELRRMMRYEQSSRINDLVIRSREIALSQALNTAARWLSRRAVQATNLGSMNVHSAYTNVLTHLVSTSKLKKPSADIQNLISRLKKIEKRTDQFSVYELATQLSMVDFINALRLKSQSKQSLSAGLLEPYVDSLEGRLDALKPTYQIVDKFITIVNDLLTDKSLEFSLSHGFTIKNSLGRTLEPSQLSSGEQQLLLLFCYVLTSRDNPSVFIIDEPEISLNIKWQRQLVQSLLEITTDADIQFLFASHSMELISQHRNYVVKLVNEK